LAKIPAPRRAMPMEDEELMVVRVQEDQLAALVVGDDIVLDTTGAIDAPATTSGGRSAGDVRAIVGGKQERDACATLTSFPFPLRVFWADIY
jgi:glyceraldehyde-3-phosphate dehydrogenase/erythrose-4-phosphate dehydrogenase